MVAQIKSQYSQGFEIVGDMNPGFERVLTEEALAFVSSLVVRFTERRNSLLDLRRERQSRRNAGEMPDFLPQTRYIREGDWKVIKAPADLQDRRVEITGPVDRKMIINALNSGARVYMADLEDAHSPTWAGTIQGQINLLDAVAGDIRYTSPEGKHYALNNDVATLIVRPRGWHLPESHVLFDGEPIPGALLDFGLFFFHNAHQLLDKGAGPYFYIPKLEGYLEARLWNDIFDFSEQALNLAHGSIKATVLIETIPAVFEMDEILYEMRDYIVGLNCGRWDYLFSYIKCFHKHPEFVLPDRTQVGMTRHFLRSYSQLLIKTCHRRGAFAMGGMAAQIPIKGDPEANAEALEKVREDKEREATDGHDGTWVAHPGLVPIAMEVFDTHMPQANQLGRLRTDVQVSADDLLQVPQGQITEAGAKNNISAALRYMAAWLGGQGAVPIHHLMEDVATAEIARAQLWQWIRYDKGVLDDGREIDRQLFESALEQELNLIKEELGEQEFANSEARYQAAAQLLRRLTLSDDFAEFLTLEAYKQLS
ncbi:MAG: malate synthase A [Pseudomonadota bacterium]